MPDNPHFDTTGANVEFVGAEAHLQPLAMVAASSGILQYNACGSTPARPALLMLPVSCGRSGSASSTPRGTPCTACPFTVQVSSS